ncbi:MAG TPA: hypothetical protein VK922_18405 [Gemmatimonadaceae bacterium]|nr:hypothetical protein [Gemmatimonadaceae bacterium]
MRKHIDSIGLAALSLVVAALGTGCDRPSPTETSAEASGHLLTRGAPEKQVPMQGRFSGPVVPALPGDEGAQARCVANAGPAGEHPGAFVTQTGNYTGRFGHLGRVTAFSTFCVDPTIGPPVDMLQGLWIITAANGDALHVSFEGRVGDFIGPNIVSWHTEDTFVGGTGRFAGASGGGPCEGTADLSTGLVNGECEYLIAYDASDRRRW